MNNEKIRVCCKCGAKVIASELPDYDFQCLLCDEDLFTFETELFPKSEYAEIIADAEQRFKEMQEIDASEESEHKDATDEERRAWSLEEALANHVYDCQNKDSNGNACYSCEAGFGGCGEATE